MTRKSPIKSENVDSTVGQVNELIGIMHDRKVYNRQKSNELWQNLRHKYRKRDNE